MLLTNAGVNCSAITLSEPSGRYKVKRKYKKPMGNERSAEDEARTIAENLHGSLSELSGRLGITAMTISNEGSGRGRLWPL